QAAQEAGVQDGAHPPPLRAQGVGGAEDHRQVLDHQRAPGADRPRDLEGAMMQLAGKRVLVVGLARSGIAAARFCAARGATVTVTDAAPAAKLAAAIDKLGGCAKLEIGGHVEASFTGADLIVMSPGVPELPEMAAARGAGVEVIAEIELAYRFLH